MNATAHRSERDAKLMAALLEWRRQTASKFEVPVFYILQEKTLRHIVDRKPLTLEGLLHIDGIAEVKLSYFGSELLEILETYLSPGERALKDYASAVPVKSCCHLCNLCESVTCPGCGVVHSNPHNNWSTTNSLLYQIKPGQKTENSATVDMLKRRKTDTSTEFIMKRTSELYCPLNSIKRPKTDEPSKKNEERIDEESVEIQNAFLRKMAQREMTKGMPEAKRPEPSCAKKSTAAKKKGSIMGERSDAAKRTGKASVKKGSQRKESGKKNTTPVKKANLRKKKRGKKKPKKKAETPMTNDSSVLLDKSFWDMASKVKKRAREALKRQEPEAKKPKASKRSIPAWIGQSSASTSTAALPAERLPLFEEPPDLDTCSIPVLKKFLNQNGFTCPPEIIDASELRALAKNSLPAWEVHRVLNCEKLPLPKRHRAVLRLTSTDDIDKMRSNFRKLSLIVHPDKNCLSEASHAFYLLQSAVQYLSTALRRC